MRQEVIELININKLKGKMVEKELTIPQLAQILQINKSTLYRKLKNNGDNITIKEANLIVSTLNLTSSEATAIFFNKFIA